MFGKGKLVSRQERWNYVRVTPGRERILFIYILSDLLMDELDDTFILIIQKDSWLRLQSKVLSGNWERFPIGPRISISIVLGIYLYKSKY